MGSSAEGPWIFYRRFRDAARARSFLFSISVAMLSGGLSACLYLADERFPFIRPCDLDGNGEDKRGEGMMQLQPALVASSFYTQQHTALISTKP